VDVVSVTVDMQPDRFIHDRFLSDGSVWRFAGQPKAPAAVSSSIFAPS